MTSIGMLLMFRLVHVVMICIILHVLLYVKFHTWSIQQSTLPCMWERRQTGIADKQELSNNHRPSCWSQYTCLVPTHVVKQTGTPSNDQFTILTLNTIYTLLGRSMQEASRSTSKLPAASAVLGIHASIPHDVCLIYQGYDAEQRRNREL